MLKKTVGGVLILIGMFFAWYMCLWMLFVGLIDIFQNQNITKGILMIIFREIAGLVVGGGIAIFGFFLMSGRGVFKKWMNILKSFKV